MPHMLVDKELCTQCGICAKICSSCIIDPGSEDNLPQVQDVNIPRCLYCGHCEAFCPSQALVLNDRPEEKISLPEDAGSISSDDIAFYLKKRRSIRHYTKELIPREKFLKSLM